MINKMFRSATKDERTSLFGLLRGDGRTLFLKPESFYDDNPSLLQVWNRDYRAGFALLGHWRRSLGNGAIHVFEAPIRKRRLFLQHLLEVMADSGVKSVVSPMAMPYEVPFYKRAGFLVEEKLILYSKTNRKGVFGFRRDSLAGECPETSGSVREYEPGDFKATLIVDNRAFSPFWAFGEEELDLLLEDAFGLVAEAESRLAGYALISERSQWGSILRLAVDPELQGRGLGAGLLSAALEWFKERGVKEIGLSTQADNERSKRLYRRFGFHPLQEQRYFLVHGDA